MSHRAMFTLLSLGCLAVGVAAIFAMWFLLGRGLPIAEPISGAAGISMGAVMLWLYHFIRLGR